MFSVALIVFREVLEAALLIGIVFAATRGVAARGRWILTGIVVGMVGAVAVALAAEKISASVEGMGQELFNALVLFAAVLMLSWHTVWMKAHARELVASSRELGREVGSGQRPLYLLAIIVCLAVLREGSEIVLFLASMLAAGSTTSSGIVVGSAIGLFGGALLGSGIAVGLLKIPTKYLFAVTAWWIALLAAGMTAQAIAFLVQAGFVTNMTGIAWDTSQVVTDRSIYGQALHALLGYISAPMTIQVIAYGTIMTILGYALLRKESPAPHARDRHAKSSTPLTVSIAVAVLVAMSCPLAYADFKVYSPYVEYGEWELEFRGARSFDDDGGKDNAQGYVYELAYSPTTHWHTAVFLETEREPRSDFRPAELAWENLFQLTEPGEYWLDLGAYVEYSKGLRQSDDHALEWKLLAEKTVGRWTVTANPIFVKEFTEGRDPGVEFEYAWGTYYRLQQEFEPGFEAFGTIGEISDANSLSTQEHFVGPDIRGRIHLGKRDNLVYNLGYLFGVTDAAPTGTVKLEVEYELRF